MMRILSLNITPCQYQLTNASLHGTFRMRSAFTSVVRDAAILPNGLRLGRPAQPITVDKVLRYLERMR